uniref:THAP-type domain-containing protein n=1 Tax=Cacopsylla melanoneura TaxID=428564 RepID=A0A8D8WLB5_9HEMI
MNQALSRCVCRCKIDSSAQVNPVLLKFPENPEMQDKWLQAIKNGSGWNFGGILETSRLCSAHFKEEDLYRNSLDCLKAKEYAVPSIFETFPLANNTATRSSSRSETVTSASLAKNEESSPSPPSSPEDSNPSLAETEVKMNRKKQILRSPPPGKRGGSSSPPNQREAEDSKDLLAMTNMSADLEEMTETTDDEMETTDSKMEVIESEHMYTKRLDSGDEKPCVIKSENISPPPSPPEIIKTGKKSKKKHTFQLRQRRILPKPMILPDTTPLSHIMSSRTSSGEPDEVTGTVLMMEFDKDGDVNVTETLVKQAQKIKKLEKENRQLKTMVDNYQNMLKEMGVIVNVSFV